MMPRDEILADDTLDDHLDDDYMIAEALSDILNKANDRLRQHQEWLATYTQTSQLLPSSSSKLITTGPSIFPRQTLLPECNDISATAFNAGANSASSVFSISLASISSTASVTILSLSDAIVRAEASASAALSAATSSLFVAQSSMNIAISIAEKSASSMVFSASEMVASANAAAEQAKANATAVIKDAENRILYANQAAQASILASQTAAMNTTKFALALTFSILGSSLVTIMLFYLIMRWRKRRTEKRQAELKQKIHLRNTTPSPPPISSPALGAIIDPVPPIPVSLTSINAERSLEQGLSQNTPFRPASRHINQSNDRNDNDSDSEIFGLPHRSLQEIGGDTNKPSIKNQDLTSRNEEVKQGEDTFKATNVSNRYSPTPSHKPTLQYDPERPTEPPIWLDNGFDYESIESEIVPPPKSQNRLVRTQDDIIGAAI